MMAEIENWPWWMVWPLGFLAVVGGVVFLEWSRSSRRRSPDGGRADAELRRKLLARMVNARKGKDEKL